MKILVLLLYYERPNMVKNALCSLKVQEYKDWELAFLDACSKKDATNVVKDILLEDIDKVKFLRSSSNNIGSIMNQAMVESTADICIMLCDDDAIFPEYFSNLVDYFSKNNKNYCYSHVVLYNPFIELPDELSFTNKYVVIGGQCLDRYKNVFNKTISLKPQSSVDASQVAWRLTTDRKQFVPLFNENKTTGLDADFYKQLYSLYGSCCYSGFCGQYKGVFDGNLSSQVSSKCKKFKVLDLPNR